VWTPRRISLGLTGLVVFAAAYFGYARLLGNLDGLPPLPEQFEDPGPVARDPVALPTGNSMSRKLELAFGLNCPELWFPHRVEMKGKGVILAFNEFKIIKEGERTGWIEF